MKTVFIVIEFTPYDGEETDKEIKGIYKTRSKALSRQEDLQHTSLSWRKSKIEPWVVQ